MIEFTQHIIIHMWSFDGHVKRVFLILNILIRITEINVWIFSSFSCTTVYSPNLWCEMAKYEIIIRIDYYNECLYFQELSVDSMSRYVSPINPAVFPHLTVVLLGIGIFFKAWFFVYPFLKYQKWREISKIEDTSKKWKRTQYYGVKKND